MESGEIPVIVPFPIKRDNSVNGTVREHPVWRRCWLVCAAPLCGGCAARLQGGCCPPVEPAAGAAPGGHRGTRQHACEPAAGRRAPHPALDGKRPLAGGWRCAVAGPLHPRACPAAASPLVQCCCMLLGSAFARFAVTLQ